MCGRYTGNDTESGELAEIYALTAEHYPSCATKLMHGEIAPTDYAPIIFADGKNQKPIPARFGYPSPKGRGVIFNARQETAAEKIIFRESLLLRRCAVPTTGYLEWDSEKKKYLIRQSDKNLLWLGGFCRRFDDGAHFVILTTTPNESVRHIHSRMPIILPCDYDARLRFLTDSDYALNYIKNEMPPLIASIV